MSSLLPSWVPLCLFAFLSLPLVWQDVKDSSVSLALLVGVYALWLTAALAAGQAGRLAAAAIVLLAGALLSCVLPDRLGEADIVFMSGMASLFAFWPLMIAVSLGCVAALAAFLWLSRGGRGEVLGQPLPLLPSLYWGGLAVILGGIKF